MNFRATRIAATKIAAAPIAVIVILAILTACGEDNDAASSSPEPQISIPDSVSLSEPDTKLDRDESASVVWDAGSEAVSVITVRVKSFKRGDMKDFRFFSLGKEQKDAVPFYVTLHVANKGPAGLGGRVPPVRLLTADNTTWLPNPIYGELESCQPTQLPDSFLPDEESDVCLVYFIDKDAKPTRITVQGESDTEPVYWQVPDVRNKKGGRKGATNDGAGAS